MQEENDFAHKSRYDGRMHGCGHDGHTTMLLAAARYLHETRRFDGTAYLIFQPGEEGYAGAQGDDRRRAVRALSRRSRSTRCTTGRACRRGGSASRPGRRWRRPTASRSRSTASGGHGAHPHAAIDPGARRRPHHHRGAVDRRAQREPDRHGGGQPVRDARRQSRRDERDPGAREARRHRAHVPSGDAGHDRAAPDRARADDRRGVRRDARRCNYERVYPATINHDARGACSPPTSPSRWSAPSNVVRNLDPSMGSEDFSFMLQAKPGAFARLGQGGAEGGCFLHNSTYDFNDEVIPLGAGYLAALAERRCRCRRRRSGARVDPVAHFSQTYAEAREQFPRRRGGPPARGRVARASGRIRGAEGEALVDGRRAGGGPGRAGPAAAVVRRRTASKAICGSGCQIALAARRRVPARDRRGRRRGPLRARAQSVRLFARAPRQRGQRRPQPQLPRLRGRAARQRRLRRNPRGAVAADMAADAPRTKRSSAPGSPRTASARSRRRCSGGQYEFPGRPLLRRREARVEQSHPARGAARACGRSPPARAGSIFIPGSAPRPRREDLRGRRRCRQTLRARATGGARTSRRFYDGTSTLGAARPASTTTRCTTSAPAYRMP